MKKCTKCEKDANGAFFVEGGNCFQFCKECTDIIETFPTGYAITTFINFGKYNLIEKNILEAKKRRIRGETIWE